MDPYKTPESDTEVPEEEKRYLAKSGCSMMIGAVLCSLIALYLMKKGFESLAAFEGEEKARQLAEVIASPIKIFKTAGLLFFIGTVLFVIGSRNKKKN